jgi:uncharacterized protein
VPRRVDQPGVSGRMTTALAVTTVLLVLVATNIWVHVGPRRVHLVTGPLAALLLVLVGRMTGLTWPELGLGRRTLPDGAQVGAALAAAVAIGYAVAVAIPFTRGAFRDTRYRIGPRAALHMSLVAIPLGTVLFEEVAFRGVLWGLLSRDYGPVAATSVSACLFGLWHVLPAMDLSRTHLSLKGHLPVEGHAPVVPPASRRVAVTVLATVAFTTLAGVVFAELRRRTGSLVTPICLHWATNGLGVLAAARVWSVTQSDVRTRDSETTETSATLGPVGQPAWQRIVRRLWSSRS